MNNNDDDDVIVVGGGPAGSTVATLVAAQGHRVTLLERDAEPRFKIGESLMPSSYWTFKRLGILDKLAASGFPRKHSVQFFSSKGTASSPFYFSQNNPHESAVTWQVRRHEFDQLLLDNAVSKGVHVRRGISVQKALYQDHQAVGVQAKLENGCVQDLPAKIVVDASGQSALLARKMNIKKIEPELKKASIFTHFKGGYRDTGIDAGATLILHTKNKDSWFWYIPLHDDIVSVGVVGNLDYLLQSRKDLELQQIFADELSQCSPIQHRLQHAEQLLPVKVTQDFSYRADRIAGTGWVLVGDAFGFLDPMYSSGILLALKSGELAADCINDALTHNDLSGERLGRFGPELVSGMEAIRKLIYAFYNKEFSFSWFLKKHPECAQGVVDILSGDVFKDGINDIFEPMGKMIDLPATVTLA